MDKAIASDNGVFVVITVLLCTIFVTSTPKTIDKKQQMVIVMAH
jgi:hypothetical protein